MWVTVVLLLLCSTIPIYARISCKGITGKNVDWFVAYKLPANKGSFTSKGDEFYYADAQNPSWTASKKLIGDQNSAIGATLLQAYGKQKSTFTLMYNDDSPNAKVESYRGHTKGTMAFDKSSGFWMIHSVPNFPPTESYYYPDTGLKFGQSFFCATLDTENLGDIGTQLTYTQATPYQSQVPSDFELRFPVLRNVIAKQSLPSSATVYTSLKHLRTLGGSNIHHFAKHKKFKKDLWLDFIAKETETNLAVESWLNGGADDLKSSCKSGTNVYDIENVAVPAGVFNSSKDHSKWGVSDSQSVPLVCVGDLNRQKSQLDRGGGAMCIEHTALWRTYKASVKKTQTCNSRG